MGKTSPIAAALSREPLGAAPATPQSIGPAHGIAHGAAAGQASRIDGNFPAGVYDQSLHGQLAPFVGGHQLPTGQTINVSMNAPSPHLSFGEWVKRGIVAGIGNLLAWPFRFVGGMLEEVGRTIIRLLGKVVLLLLVPTLLIVGYKMAQHVTKAPSVEEGAAQVVHNGRHAVNGALRGFNDQLPDENDGIPKSKRRRDGKDADAER